MSRPLRVPIAASLVALASLFVAACGDASSSPTTTTTAPPSAATQLAWLTSHARQWNAALNSDQNSVDTAAASGSTSSSSSAFLGRLSAACTKMLADAEKAKTVPAAPSATLQRAWEGMVAATESYASKCLKVVQSDSTADVTTWQNSLKSMNSASATWNNAVNAVRGAAGSSSG